MGPIRSVAVGAKYLYTESIGAWRSLVAHLLWEQRVGGSNPLAPTNKRGPAGPFLLVGMNKDSNLRMGLWRRD